jgi:FixJ family two-component response regulator
VRPSLILIGRSRHSPEPLAVNYASEAMLSERALISVVDDDRSVRESMRRLLRALGYAVAVFPSAAEFLASAELTSTACLVSDVRMPAMTGVDLYAHLVRTGRAIPTILITAYPDDNVQERVRALGVEGYLHKPLEEAELVRCIHSALEHGRPTQGAS